MINVIGSPVDGLQAALIGIIFGIVDQPMEEPLALKAKEAEAHAKKGKSRTAEAAQTELHSLEVMEKGTWPEALGATKKGAWPEATEPESQLATAEGEAAELEG